MSSNENETYEPDQGDVTKQPTEYSNETGNDFVQRDEKVDDPIDPNTADSDEQLARDDNDAIDESNIVEDRTRGAGPREGYTDPDEDDIPSV
ncbi:MAG: hypothetical protein M1825_000719 [Sarcosagium campestre]|nr:MAG: hypothetical protein M1825_000719 [Sarcosagium campestre]